MASQLLALGLTFALLTWAMFSIIALFSVVLVALKQNHPSFANGLGWLTGGVLIRLGLRLPFSDRR